MDSVTFAAFAKDKYTMKILLILDNLSSSCGANVGIVYDLAKSWLERGHDVYCMRGKIGCFECTIP